MKLMIFFFLISLGFFIYSLRPVTIAKMQCDSNKGIVSAVGVYELEDF